MINLSTPEILPKAAQEELAALRKQYLRSDPPMKYKEYLSRRWEIEKKYYINDFKKDD